MSLFLLFAMTATRYLNRPEKLDYLPPERNAREEQLQQKYQVATPAEKKAGILARDKKTGEPVYAKTEDQFMHESVKRLQARIKEHWQPPKSKTSHEIVVFFTVDGKTGTVKSSRIKTSSGNTEADEAALKAIRKAEPYPPIFIDDLHKNYSMKFTFDYNVHRKKKKT